MIDYRIYHSKFGDILLGFKNGCLVYLGFTDVATPYREIDLMDGRVFLETKRWLDIYCEGAIPDFIPNVYIGGSDFYVTTIKQTREVLYGDTITYCDLAQMVCKILKKKYTSFLNRAIGRALGANKIALIFPCHRIVGKNGNLCGYGYGLDRKRLLLEFEDKWRNNVFVY